MWGSAFAVCVMQSSLTCQFEHSGKVRSGLVNGFGNLFFIAITGSASFPPCCADESTQYRTKQFCPHYM